MPFKPRKTVKLTDEERTLVADNIGIAWTSAAKYTRHRQESDFEDARSVASLALCRAAKLYNPSLGPFHKYAFMACDMAIRGYFHTNGMIRIPLWYFKNQNMNSKSRALAKAILDNPTLLMPNEDMGNIAESP